MRSRGAFVGVLFVLLLLSCAASAEPATEVDPGGCPTPETWALPAEALTADAAMAVDVPLIPGPSTLECPDVDLCGVHFQEIFVDPLPVGAANLTSLSFRLDESTPLETLAGDLCWSVQVELGSYPYDVEDVSPTFRNNIVDPVQVYDGPLCLLGAEGGEIPALGEELRIEFAVPYPYDPVAGNLVVEVTIDSLVGADQGLLLDAADAATAVSVVALDGDGAVSGQLVDGGPIVVIDGVPGDVLPGDPKDCVQSLNAPDFVRDVLVSYLADAEDGAFNGDWKSMHRNLRRYVWSVNRYERRGDITSEVADRALELGSVAAATYHLPFAFESGLATHADISALWTLIWLPELVGPQVPEGSRAADALEDYEDAIFDMASEPVADTPDPRDVREWQRAFRDAVLRAHRFVTEDTTNFLRDAWRFLRRNWNDLWENPLFHLYLRFMGLIWDGEITSDEADALIELYRDIEKLAGESGNRDLQELFGQLPDIIGQLAAHLKSGEIQKIYVDESPEGGWNIRIDVTDGFYLKIFDETIYMGWWLGLEDLRAYLWIGDISLRVTTNPEGFEVEVGAVDWDPNDTWPFFLNLDADTGIIDIFSWWIGLDLDEVFITKVVYTSGGMVIHGFSDSGEPVKITVQGGNTTIEVNGEQVWP